MAVPQLPAVSDLAGQLAGELLAAEPTTVIQIRGRQASGKSTVLSLIERSDLQRRLTLRADPPVGANDAGPLALMQLAAGLKDADALNGETEALLDPRIRLEEKVEIVSAAIEKSQAILLLDEPAQWGRRSDTTGHFAERAEIVADALLRDVAVPKVVTGSVAPGVRVRDRRYVPDPSGGSEFLADADGWGALTDVASQLKDESGVETMTPLELRLLVAATALGARDATDPAMTRRDRAEALFEFIDGPDGPTELGDAWRRLATIRSSFGGDLLDDFARDLDESTRPILENCLLLCDQGRWSMNGNLRADAFRHRGSQDEMTVIRTLAWFYDRLTTERQGEGDGSMLLSWMDTAYYAAAGGLRDLTERRGCFVEQLDLLGKALSQQRNYRGAVEVFELALKLDDEDDYAAHYIGFNLDRAGLDATRAETSYRLAIDLNDRHAWWRSRLISFLAERGQLVQARREWDDAIDAVSPPDGSSDMSLYETLHGWVASTLLRVGELAFARDVLDEVPDELVERSPSLRELRVRLRGFELADSEGAYVPAHLLRDGWWAAPSLLQRRVGEDDTLLLRRWLAGRIEFVGDKEVELRVAEMKVGGDEPRFARTRISVGDFDKWSRDGLAAELSAGRFVEIGLYSEEDGSNATRLLRIHPATRVGDEVPPPLGPLDRWHRQLAGVRT